MHFSMLLTGQRLEQLTKRRNKTGRFTGKETSPFWRGFFVLVWNLLKDKKLNKIEKDELPRPFRPKSYHKLNLLMLWQYQITGIVSNTKAFY